jgi:signal transduction histidine kinase
MRYEHPGIGIGLYATGMIVQAHHGRITARSQPGVGSTFVLNVPIQDPEDVSVQ